MPDRPVKIAAWNVLSLERGEQGVIDLLKQQGADVIMLSEVQDTQVQRLAEATGLHATFVEMLHSPEPMVHADASARGCLLLTRWPMVNVTPLGHATGGKYGVRADVIADGNRFTVAVVHLSATWKFSLSHLEESAVARWKEIEHLMNDWRDRGQPPMIVAGDFNNLPVGDNYYNLTQTWTDIVKPFDDGNTFASGLIRTRIDYVFTSRDWQAANAGIVYTDASDHRMIHATLQASDAATTQPN